MSFRADRLESFVHGEFVRFGGGGMSLHLARRRGLESQTKELLIVHCLDGKKPGARSGDGDIGDHLIGCPLDNQECQFAGASCECTSECPLTSSTYED